MEASREQYLFLRRRAGELYLEGFSENARRLLSRVDEEQERRIRRWMNAQAERPSMRGGSLRAER